MLKYFLKNQKGAVFSLEFAMIAPLFILLFLIVIELCRLLFVATVLDMITVEGSYYVTKSNPPVANYSKLFYQKISEDIPSWSLLTSDDNLEVNITYCSTIDDATQFMTLNSGCSSTPTSHSVAVFRVKYHYSPLIASSSLISFDELLVRQVVIFKEF